MPSTGRPSSRLANSCPPTPLRLVNSRSNEKLPPEGENAGWSSLVTP